MGTSEMVPRELTCLVCHCYMKRGECLEKHSVTVLVNKAENCSDYILSELSE
jgi:hypothetical protein